MRRKYKVVYRPWSGSEFTQEISIWATDEDAARREFTRQYPEWVFMEVKPDTLLHFPR